jgi:hypothetical protein
MDWTYRLRLRQLQVLLSLTSTGNLSQSAAALNTTQPALSKWLKELEEDIGLPLFERHARGLRPTSYGEALIEHARRIDASLNTARDDMQALREGGSGLVTIGNIRGIVCGYCSACRGSATRAHAESASAARRKHDESVDASTRARRTGHRRRSLRSAVR